MRTTVKEHIAELQRLMAEGKITGDEVVAVTSQDNNARSGFANLELKPRVASVAKADFEKGWTIVKFVSTRGVPVVVLG